MKLLKVLFLQILLINISFVCFALRSDTVWNQTDKNDLKQGFWRVNYENGKIKYQGCFKDGKPVGQMKRYYDDGVVKAIQLFVENNNKSKVKIYYQNGELAGEGNLIGTIKDSIWRYYSYYDKTLKMEESYGSGYKEGLTRKYYSNGKPAEELNWQKNQKNGLWVQYFDNGILKLKSNYLKDIRTGEFSTFYPNSKIETSGHFENNLMEGEWIYFDENGAEKTRVKYIKGIAQNAQQIEEEQKQFFKLIEDMKGKIPEPDENSLTPVK